MRVPARRWQSHYLRQSARAEIISCSVTSRDHRFPREKDLQRFGSSRADFSQRIFLCRRLPANGVNGMNTPCWEAGGWTALVVGIRPSRSGDRESTIWPKCVTAQSRVRRSLLRGIAQGPAQRRGSVHPVDRSPRQISSRRPACFACSVRVRCNGKRRNERLTSTSNSPFEQCLLNGPDPSRWLHLHLVDWRSSATPRACL